jgi:predicted Zn finger-like uncharacterized protein
MIIVCPSCQARYKFDESKLGERPKAKTRCAKCGGTIEIENPALSSVTLPPGLADPEPTPPPMPVKTEAKRSRPAMADDQGATITGKDLHRMGLLELPKDKRFSLAIIQGAATGQIHQITKTRTMIGRAGADINLDDPECSRQHAVLEILGETAILRDLDSTNGTYIDIDRIQQQVLSNQMEFRIGSHVLMFIVTDVE